MSSSPLLDAIRLRLRDAGYSDIDTPFRVAGVDFAFTGAMHGRHGRALDLVLLFDTTTGDFGDRDADRIRQRVEALGRALDVTGSRYVVTAILAGATLGVGVEALAETCRVLQVHHVALDPAGRPAGDDARQRLEDQILLLLPFGLPDGGSGATDASGTAIDMLVRALPTTAKAMTDALIAASAEGEEAVTLAVGKLVGAPFENDNGEDKT